MFKLNPIATNCTFSSASFYPTIVGSFYNLSCESSTSLYHTLDHTQLIQRNDLKSRSTPKNLARNEPPKIPPETLLKQESIASSAIPPQLFAASIAFIQDLDFYEQDRAIGHNVLAQGNRYRSARSATRATPQNEDVAIGRTRAENPRCSAQKKDDLQRHETIADKGLRAFLSAIAGRKRSEIGHRYNLKKAAQVGTRSTQITIKPLQKAARSTHATTRSLQLINFQKCCFWQWFKQPSDLPNSGIYERNQTSPRHVLRQRDRHRSDQIGTIDTSSFWRVAFGQDKPSFALSSRQFAQNTKHETLTGESLRAFLPVIAVRTWGASANRCSLEKSAQTEARSPQADSYQGRNFWQWIEPPPDIPIDILEGAASLQEGGAAL